MSKKQTAIVTNEQQILLSAQPVKFPDPKCGIYFLIKDQKVVYIGKSTNIDGRILQHSASKDFDAFSWVPYMEDQLCEMEPEYIMHYKPLLNQRIPKSRFMSKASIKKEFNVHMGKAKRVLKLNGASEYSFNGMVYYDRNEVSEILEAYYV